MKVRSVTTILFAIYVPVLAAGVVAEIAAPVAVVPYWSYWLTPVIAALNIAVMFLINRRITVYGMIQESTKKEIVQGIDQAKQQVVVLERQINSNLDKQIKASINDAISSERLRVEKEKEKEKATVNDAISAERLRVEKEKK